MGEGPENLREIRRILRQNPKGLSISDISRKVELNRNSVAKYLDMLLISGQAEMRTYGAAKVYTASQRLPISALLEYSSDLIVVLDDERRILQINTPFITFSGQKREDLQGTELSVSGLPVVTTPAVLSILNDQLTGEAVIPEVAWGDESVFRAKVLPTTFEEGGSGTTIILEDLTEIKRAWKMRNFLANIVESTEDAVIGKDFDGKIVSWNEGAERLYGYTQEEMIGRTLDPLVPPEKNTEMDKIFDEVEAGCGIDLFETVRMRKDGSRVDVAISVSPVRDEAGRVVGASTIARDITTRKRHEEETMFLSRTAMNFVEMEDNDDEIFGYIGRQIMKLLPGSTIFVSSYESDLHELCIEAMVREGGEDGPGRELVGTHVPMTPGQGGPVQTHLYEEVAFADHPAAALAGGKDRCMYAPLICHGTFFGDVVVLLTGEAGLKGKRTLIEEFMRQAAVALHRRHARLVLEKSWQRARTLLDASFDLAVLTDPAGVVLDLNEHAGRIFGRAGEKRAGPLHTALDRMREKVLREGRPAGGTVQACGKTFAISMTPVMAADGRVHEIAVFLRDSDPVRTHMRGAERRF